MKKYLSPNTYQIGIGDTIEVHGHMEKVTDIKPMPQSSDRSAKFIPIVYSGSHMIESHEIKAVFKF